MSANKLALQSCDECNKRRVRCNRVLPCCKNCLRRGDACTYLRKLKIESFLNDKPYLAERITVFRKSKRKFKDKERSLKKIEDVSNFNIIISDNITKSYKSDWQYNAYQLTIGTPDRNLLNFLMVIFDFPLLSNKFTNTCKAFIKVLNEVNPWAKKEIVPYKKCNLSTTLKDMEMKYLLDLAIENYFEYFNPIIPLFIKNNFYNKTRSKLLLMAIWITGLSIDMNLFFVQKVRENLQHLFTLELKNNYHRPTLDLLQSYILSINWYLGYRGKPTNSSILGFIPIHLLHSLGLHLNLSKNKLLFNSSDNLLERDMLYSGLIFLESNWASGNNTPCMINLDHSISPKILNEKEIDYYLNLSSNINYCIYDLIMICISRCNYHDSCILQRIRLLRNLIHNNLIESINLLNEIRNLQSNCRQLFLSYLKLLHGIKKSILNKFGKLNDTSLKIIDRAIYSLNMRFRIVYRDITILLLHLNPDNLNQQPSKQMLEIRGSIYVTEVIEEVIRVILAEKQFDLLPYHTSRPSHIGKCLILLMKLQPYYIGTIDLNFQIQQVYQRMELFKTVSSWASQVSFNLFLAEQFKDSNFKYLNSNDYPSPNSTLFK